MGSNAGMETATSLVIGQLSGYMRGLTQRLDPGTGWYGEFLRRDPEGMRACLDGAAMPPWDVLESLLGDLAARPGPAGALAVVDPDVIARETRYAAGLRAAAVVVWDRLPGGVEELRTLLAAALAQRSQAQASLRALSARLDRTADPAQADALSRELSWTRDDAARAAARHEDLTARLAMVAPAAAEPLAGVPAQRSGGPEQRSGVPAQPSDRPEQGSGGTAEAQAPVGRAEGRWLRGARRSGGARYAGAAVPEAQEFTPPPGAPSAEAPCAGPASAAPRGRSARTRTRLRPTAGTRSPRATRRPTPQPTRQATSQPIPSPVPPPTPRPRSARRGIPSAGSSPR